MATEIKPIRTKRDHEAALKEVERLRGAKAGTPAGNRLDVLATLIDAYGAEHCPSFGMTKLLEQGNKAVEELPAERQDMAGELLLTLVAREPRRELTREQIEDLRLAIEQADRGEFATDSDIDETWKKLGL